MNDNLYIIAKAVDYIEAHLADDKLNLDTLSQAMGYSKYHMHRIFSAVTGMPPHSYIQRRRLTEAARALVFTTRPIMDIALDAGYDTQRSFSRSFKSICKLSPGAYRKRKSFLPLQLPYDVSRREPLRGDRILDIHTIETGEIHFTGYHGNTRHGFQVIGQCWRRLHKNKHRITGRTDLQFLVGVNDYSHFEHQDNRPSFTYMAGAQVTDPSAVPKGMVQRSFPPGKYIVFSFRGKNEDSLQPVVEYIYKEWFPHATCRFNEKMPFDFAKYGELTDVDGQSDIQYWVPIA